MNSIVNCNFYLLLVFNCVNNSKFLRISQKAEIQGQLKESSSVSDRRYHEDKQIIAKI